MKNRFLREEFEKNIPGEIKKALAFCSKAADELGLPIFLIGGIVRDIIINKKNFDVDITVQGNAIEFAQSLQNKYPEIFKLKETHDSFKTAKVVFNIDGKCVDLDLASTRKESYPYPSGLPVVEKIGCELYEDVIRRDFSINSMALSLNKDSFYRLVDYLNGYDDLQEGVLEILHEKSFIDDPTRIIRGLKFSVRFGYKPGEKTQKLMRECLESGQFDNLAGERVKLELKQAFNLNRAECLARFINEKIYRLVDTGISALENIDEIAFDAQKTISEYSKFIQNNDNIWLIYLGTLLSGCIPEKINHIAQKLYLSGNEKSVLLYAQALCEKQGFLRNSKSRFEVYEFFEKAQIESIIVFLIKNKDLKDKVDLFLNGLKDIKISIDGNNLIQMGLKPGPLFSEVLREVLKARVNGEITSYEQEIELVKKFN